MGWRSWNVFGADVTQQKVEGIMEAMVSKRGEGRSLLDLGYRDVGLDDGWQACGDGVRSGFHAADGTPLVNLTRFPSLEAMTRKAHDVGLTAGWYVNNCLCPETTYREQEEITAHYEGDVKAFVEYGFDSVKLDHCGQFNNHDRWAAMLQEAHGDVLIESCFWIGLVPAWDDETDELWCPFDYFRISGDIEPTFDSIVTNLQTMPKWAELRRPISQPGCWAYLDMLEVGNLPTYEQNRAHFAAWAITSSPLILGIDAADSAKMDSILSIITNEEVVAVNQNWAGHPGTVVFTQHMNMGDLMPAYPWAVRCDPSDPRQRGWSLKSVGVKVQIASPSGLCLDVTVASPAGLSPCSPLVPGQLFDMAPGGKITFTTAEGSTECIEVYGKTGPVLQRTRCFEGAPKHQRFRIEKGIWSDFGMKNTKSFPPRCIAARGHYPLDLSAHYISWQIWAKPQPQGALAVLILNRAVDGLDRRVNVSLLRDFFEERLFPVLGDGSLEMRDLYNQTSVGIITESFPTGLVPQGDSRLFLLTPVQMPAPVAKSQYIAIGLLVMVLAVGGGALACAHADRIDRYVQTNSATIKLKGDAGTDVFDSESGNSDETELEEISVVDRVKAALHGSLFCGKVYS